MRDIRLAIKEEINRRGFQQASIAKMAGMTPQQLTDVVKLRRKLDANEMIALCGVMGIDISALVNQSSTARAGRAE